MTTTEPTTAWIDTLVPAEVREEGRQLLAEVLAVRASLAPLLARCGRLLEADDAIVSRLSADFDAMMTKEVASDASDGIGHIVGTLTHALELNATLARMGVDPDSLPTGEGVQE